MSKKPQISIHTYGISNNMTNFDIYMNVTKTDYLSNVSNTPSKNFRMEKNTTSDNINDFTCTFIDSSCLSCLKS